eukprot:2072250-Pleurochrysis_carterae.AAC.1
MCCVAILGASWACHTAILGNLDPSYCNLGRHLSLTLGGAQAPSEGTFRQLSDRRCRLCQAIWICLRFSVVRTVDSGSSISMLLFGGRQLFGLKATYLSPSIPPASTSDSLPPSSITGRHFHQDRPMTEQLCALLAVTISISPDCSLPAWCSLSSAAPVASAIVTILPALQSRDRARRLA